jgi:hypothetical protein
VGYGDPVPYDGISKFVELLAAYVGTSFRTRLSERVRSAFDG